MRTHYDLQREVIEAALRLLDDIELHGDAFGIEVFRRQLALLIRPNYRNQRRM